MHLEFEPLREASENQWGIYYYNGQLPYLTYLVAEDRASLLRFWFQDNDSMPPEHQAHISTNPAYWGKLTIMNVDMNMELEVIGHEEPLYYLLKKTLIQKSIICPPKGGWSSDETKRNREIHEQFRDYLRFILKNRSRPR